MALQNFGGSLPSHRNLFHYANRLFLPLRRVDETSGERGGFGGNAGRDGGNRIDFDRSGEWRFPIFILSSDLIIYMHSCTHPLLSMSS